MTFVASPAFHAGERSHIATQTSDNEHVTLQPVIAISGVSYGVLVTSMPLRRSAVWPQLRVRFHPIGDQRSELIDGIDRESAV